MEIPPAMGVATGINFHSVAGNRAVTTGDFVLLGTEVNPVIQADGKRDRRDGRPQPHADRGAAPLFPTLLTRRRETAGADLVCSPPPPTKRWRARR